MTAREKLLAAFKNARLEAPAAALQCRMFHDSSRGGRRVRFYGLGEHIATPARAKLEKELLKEFEGATAAAINYHVTVWVKS